jgi:hypothetical protein
MERNKIVSQTMTTSAESYDSGRLCEKKKHTDQETHLNFEESKFWEVKAALTSHVKVIVAELPTL